MSPALNGSSVLQCFEHSNVIEICNGVMFDFYLGLPQIGNIISGVFNWYRNVIGVCLITFQRQLSILCSFSSVYHNKPTSKLSLTSF